MATLGIVSAWVLIPLANYNPEFFLSPQALKNVTSPPKVDCKLR